MKQVKVVLSESLLSLINNADLSQHDKGVLCDQAEYMMGYLMFSEEKAMLWIERDIKALQDADIRA